MSMLKKLLNKLIRLLSPNYFFEPGNHIDTMASASSPAEKPPEPDSSNEKPLLSIIVIVYDMPEQAYNTLLSLSASYQKNVSSLEYEVIVIENNSSNTLPPETIAQLPANFSYHLREEAGVSPAPAINYALAKCQGQYIGLLIDGARMLTPRVIEYALQGLRIPGAIVAVPGYYLTEFATNNNSVKKILSYEKKHLKAINWPENGYDLFEQACFSNGNRNGYFHPMMECNALFFEREALEKHNGVDEAFNLKGGGSLNLHLFRQLCTNTHSPLVLLAGEANLHQFHGGTSTSHGPERDQLVAEFKEQLDSYWAGGFKGVTREPYFLGSVSAQALPFMQQSINQGNQRFKHLNEQQRDPWEDDVHAGGQHA
jgi:glycosyltransferase involved in cell wall biosynthesis